MTEDERLLVELRASGDLGYHREVARRAANRLAELEELFRNERYSRQTEMELTVRKLDGQATRIAELEAELREMHTPEETAAAVEQVAEERTMWKHRAERVEAVIEQVRDVRELCRPPYADARVMLGAIDNELGRILGEGS